jgi:multiple antibiotic resistance protein
MDIEFFKSAFLTMFVAVYPMGLAPVFIAVTSHMSAADRRSTAVRSTIIAFSILAVSALLGEKLLHTLGISIPAFRIAGGLLLFSIAVEMVFERREQRRSQSAEAAITHDENKSIAAFPLAMPLMAGPGAITATILQASSTQGSIVSMIGLIVILAAVIFCCLLVFLMAEKIDKFLGVSGRVILSRLLGVLLAAMAVQTVGDGLVAFVRSIDL